MDLFPHRQHTERLRIVTASVWACVVFILLISYQFFSQYRQMSEELDTQALVISANTAASLAFNDQQAAYETLTSLEKSARINGSAIYKDDGTLFLVVTNKHDLPFPNELPANLPDEQALSSAKLGAFERFIQKDIQQDKTKIGTLVLLVNYQSFYVNLLGYALGLLLIGFLALLLSQRFTANLRKRIIATSGELERMALYDQVTGLPNRRFFEYELKKAVSRIEREEENAALLMIDVDDFKKVNDLSGHDVGDQVLLMIANRLKQTIRADDVLARIGGDEFAAILFKPGDPDHVNKITDKMIESISRPFPTEPIPSHVGLSIGITMMPTDSDDPTTLLRWADMAMYEAKALGKNRAQFFSSDINSKVRKHLQIEAGLRATLTSNARELFLAYQPQVCARNRQIVGLEALIRWIPTAGNMIPPTEFIGVAEKTGLIINIGQWVVNQACQDLGVLGQEGIEIPKIAINVSPKEMMKGNRLVANACETLLRFRQNVRHFEFEITENALMADGANEVLSELRNSGFALAIDDFGTGYSSLGYLRRFQVSSLKIDQQFVRNLPDNTEDAAIVSAVIQMAKALGITVVAEGVETEAQAEFLTSRGCDILQGYLISRPLPLDELRTYLQQYKAGIRMDL